MRGGGGGALVGLRRELGEVVAGAEQPHEAAEPLVRAARDDLRQRPRVGAVKKEDLVEVGVERRLDGVDIAAW